MSSGAPGLTGVADVAAKVIPSVVQVDTTERSRFGTRRGTGSGVIYSADGLIITNRHVVEGGTAFQVTMSNGDREPATLVDRCFVDDLRGGLDLRHVRRAGARLIAHGFEGVAEFVIVIVACLLQIAR